MDSLDLPQDMLWSGKAEPLSPGGNKTPFASGSPFAGTAASPQLWPIEEDILLSCFDLDDDSNTTTSTTFGQQYHEIVRKKQQQQQQQDSCEDKSRAEELLLELMELKEEQWMNQENVDLSLLTAPAQQQQQHNAFASALLYNKAEPATLEGNYTELLFDEIKTFCNDFEAASYQHLTPPQSPPAPSSLFANHYQFNNNNSNSAAQSQPQHPNICYGADAPSMTSAASHPVNTTTTTNTINNSTALAHPLFGGEERSFLDLQLQSNDCLEKTFVIADDKPSPPPVNVQLLSRAVLVEQPDVALDSDLLALELIDELLRNKTKDVHENYILINTQLATQQPSPPPPPALIPQCEAAMHDDSMDYCEDSVTQFSSPSYGNSLASSPSRSGSPLDELEDSQDDDEWMPPAETSSESGGGAVKKQRRSGASSSGGSSTKRRPYERGGGEVEKKSRKKEQNKNAATRYRQKKKQEVETILEQETRLIKTNKKLVSQFNEARREMKYLRNLLREMYKKNDIVI